MIRSIVEPQEITLVVHNTAVSRKSAPIQRPSVVNTHKRKWKSPSQLNGSPIGYNFFCEATGTRTQERYIGEQTIAAIGYNWDVPSRGGYIHYCWAGYFKVEKPTQMQVDDVNDLVRELEAAGFTVKLKVQHRDVAPNRTCAELDAAEFQRMFTAAPNKETDKQKIARLEEELAQTRAMIKKLKSMVTLLIKIITK